MAFRSAAVAAKSLADQASRWSACAGRHFTVGDHDPRARTFGPMSNTGGTLAITSTSDSSLHQGYQHALAVRNNLAIDVAACRIDVTNQGIDVSQRDRRESPALTTALDGCPVCGREPVGASSEARAIEYSTTHVCPSPAH